MKIIHAETIEWKRGLEYRGGTFHFRNLLEGEAGTNGVLRVRSVKESYNEVPALE